MQARCDHPYIRQDFLTGFSEMHEYFEAGLDLGTKGVGFAGATGAHEEHVDSRDLLDFSSHSRVPILKGFHNEVPRVVSARDNPCYSSSKYYLPVHSTGDCGAWGIRE